MFDLIDAMPGGRPQVMGRTWSPTKESWTSVPADLELAQPLLWRLARKISRPIFRLDVFDGMWYGTVCDRLPPVPLAMSGLLVEWLRADRRSYLVKEVTPAQGVNLRSATTVNSGPTSFVCFYSFAPTADDAKLTPENPAPAFDDISTIYGDDNDMWDEVTVRRPPQQDDSLGEPTSPPSPPEQPPTAPAPQLPTEPVFAPGWNENPQAINDTVVLDQDTTLTEPSSLQAPISTSTAATAARNRSRCSDRQPTRKITKQRSDTETDLTTTRATTRTTTTRTHAGAKHEHITTPTTKEAS